MWLLHMSLFGQLGEFPAVCLLFSWAFVSVSIDGSIIDWHAVCHFLGDMHIIFCSHSHTIGERISCFIPYHSTGLVCDAESANEVHKYIRSVLSKMYDDEVAQNMRIQYGGSVTPDSVDGLMAMSDIDGCLVGGASLYADKFARIVNFQPQE